MRPIRRGDSPIEGEFAEYGDALPHLVARCGNYCSYCERRIPASLAVEHIQPKALPAYAALERTWTNFLLGCSNCNSSKGKKDVVLASLFLPDRDNTAVLFDYPQDGGVVVRNDIPQGLRMIAASTLSLTGLDKVPALIIDDNERLVAIDRYSQRMLCWLVAIDAHAEINGQPGNESLRRTVVQLALASGFFSIWMLAFANDLDMRLRFIAAFPGTAASGCFDLVTGLPIRPAPNPDNLPHGGKI